MDSSVLPIFAFFLVLLVAAVTNIHATDHQLSPQHLYWKATLPNTPMPVSISQLLQGKLGKVEETEGTTVCIGHHGIDVGVHGTHVRVGHDGHHCYVRSPDPPHNHKKKIISPGVGTNNFLYQYRSTDDQVKANRGLAIFFVEKDLQVNMRFQLQFTRTGGASSSSTGLGFIPRTRVHKIPFSSNKLPEILARFEIETNSDDSRTMANTIHLCEEGQAGEATICATSLESMVDFAIRRLGTRDHIIAVSTTVEKKKNKKKNKKEEEAAKQVYTVSSIRRVQEEQEKAVVCHIEPYMYAVYFCHEAKSTKVYEVNMLGEDGGKVKAAVVCHTDTSNWNAKHLAFQLLKVQPGSVPVCHFLPEFHVVWSRSGKLK